MSRLDDEKLNKKAQELKDEDIKRKFQEEKYSQLRKEARDIRYKERQVRRSESGPQPDDLKAYYEACDKIIEEGQRGYDSWNSALASIVTLQIKFIKAGGLFGGDLGDVITPLAENLLYYVGYPLKDAIVDRFGKPPADTPVPSLKGTIEFTADHKLDVEQIADSLRSSDGGELSEDHQINFIAGVVAWLNAVGYEPQKDAQGKRTDKFVSKNDPHELLTKDKFEELRDDTDDGLMHFLSGRFDMSVEHTHSNRP